MDFGAIFDNFIRIVRLHYFDPHGRVGRSEFWYFALAYMILAIAAGILSGITGLPLNLVYSLGMLLPAAGMGARRLQDIGRDGRLVWIPVVGGFAVQVYGAMAAVGFWLMGWFSWVLFGPLLGFFGIIVFVSWVVLIYFWIQPGEPGDNRYGPPPPRFDPATRPAV